MKEATCCIKHVITALGLESIMSRSSKTMAFLYMKVL